MQILLGLIAGTVIGLALHFSVPGRSNRGAALAPMIGAVSAGLAWTVLTWAGLGVDTPWPWLAALIVPAALTWPTLVGLDRARVAHDRRERARLKIG